MNRYCHICPCMEQTSSQEPHYVTEGTDSKKKTQVFPLLAFTVFLPCISHWHLLFLGKRLLWNLSVDGTMPITSIQFILNLYIVDFTSQVNQIL